MMLICNNIYSTLEGFDPENSRTCVENIALPLIFINYTYILILILPNFN